MLKSLSALIAVAALGGCQSPQQPATEVAAPPQATAPATPPPTTQCYGYSTQTQDTVRLALTTSGAAATGTLLYHYAEKDRNRGTIQGTFSGDTLRADYTFQSEGTTSVREVVFVRQSTNLVEGYGPVTERGGKTVFQQPTKLKFSTDMPLSPVACRP